MSAVWIRAMNELRARWRAWLAIALMVGIAGGVSMTGAEGARRSDTAVPRFLAYSGATHADIEADPTQFHEIASLPEVKDASEGAYMLMGPSVAAATHSQVPVSVIALPDPELQGGRPLLIEGRFFDESDPSQALINESALRTGVLRVGQTIPLQGFTFDQMDDVLRGSSAQPRGPSASVTIVGAIRLPTDLSTTNPPPGVIYTGNAEILITPALYARIGGSTANFRGLAVRLKRGNADIPALTTDIARITHGKGAVHAGSDDLQAGAEAQRATHTESIALWLFAGLIGLAGVLVVGQSISRQIFLGSSENGTLIALGMSRSQLVAAGTIDVLIACVVGAIFAVTLAILLTPLTPLGLAREADVDIGFHLDLPVILLGAAACIVLLVLRSVLPAFRASRAEINDAESRPSRVADVMARAAMPATSVAGVRMALDPGRGRSAVPVRTAIAGTVVAVAVLTAAVGFGASLDHLDSTPRLQGWTWDVAVGNPHSDDVSARAIPLLRANASVAAFSSEAFDNVRVGGSDVLALGLDQVTGDVGPPVLEGRAPEGKDEIALGAKALARLHKRVGDTVLVAGPLAHRTMRIVGRVLITPVIMNDQVTLGDGAWMQLAALRSFAPPTDSDQGAVNVFLIKLRAGVSRAAALASLRRDFPGTVLTPYAPAEVENLRRIDSLPYVLAILLGLLGAATIAHALVTSVRRRRRDLAILKTLGFVRSQVAATVGWQATTLALLASAIGLVAGVIGGRWVWFFFGDRLGIQPSPSIPILLLVIVVPAALFIANFVAALPARAAARTEAAVVLRTE